MGLKCGYTDFEFDHRCLWIDVPYTIAFGHKIPPIVRAAAQRLKGEDPRVVKKYQDNFISALKKLYLINRADILYEVATHPPTTAQQQHEWNTIDDLRVHAMKKSEQHCRKLGTGETPWSLAYQQGRDKVDAVSTLLQRRGGAKIGPHLCECK
jgi:hypothetical protein